MVKKKNRLSALKGKCEYILFQVSACVYTG